MPDIDEVVRRQVARERSRRQGNSYKGRIAEDAAAADDEVTVIVPNYSGEHRHGPCRFPLSNGAGVLPVRGDDCLVAFDEDEDPWIVVWYPGG